jgi:CheY-like chemotaxis protein
LTAAPAHRSLQVKAPRRDHTSRHILVVDDNVDAATSLATLLEMRGHRVRTCFGGSAAFEAASASPPEVAFIDLNMPHPDGIELSQLIRGQPWGTAVKLIALTGMGQPDDHARTRAAGFDEHLTKPVNPDDLLTAIATPGPPAAQRSGTRRRLMQ